MRRAAAVCEHGTRAVHEVVRRLEESAARGALLVRVRDPDLLRRAILELWRMLYEAEGLVPVRPEDSNGTPTPDP